MKADAILWQNPTPDGFGNYTYDDPVKIKVRWEDSQEWFRGEDGVEKLSDSVVYTTTEIETGEKLIRGNNTGSDIKNARKVEKRKECQDIKGNIVMWKLWLL